MKKILITGGFGKIAKHFVQNFNHKYEITVADIITNSETFTDNVQVVIESYPTAIQVHKDMLVKPKNMYSVSKCFGEALAAYHAYNNGISSICLRIGAYEFPKDFTEMNARDLSAYLHPDDFNQLLIGCIETVNIKHEVLNTISNNRYKRLDITESIEKVRYNPKADAFELFNLQEE